MSWNCPTTVHRTLSPTGNDFTGDSLNAFLMQMQKPGAECSQVLVKGSIERADHFGDHKLGKYDQMRPINPPLGNQRMHYGPKQKKSQINSHLISYIPMSEGVGEVSKRVNQ